MRWDTLTDRLVALGIAGFLFKVLGEAGYPAPEQRMCVVQGGA